MSLKYQYQVPRKRFISRSCTGLIGGQVPLYRADASVSTTNSISGSRVFSSGMTAVELRRVFVKDTAEVELRGVFIGGIPAVEMAGVFSRTRRQLS